VNLGGFQKAPEIDASQYEKYNPTYHNRINGYVIVQFLTSLIAGSIILFSYHKLATVPLVSFTTFTILTLITCGALFEQKKWQVKFEYVRLVAGFSLVVLLEFPIGYQVIFGGILLISVIWFYKLQKTHFQSDED
jgi:hypothetical protein